MSRRKKRLLWVIGGVAVLAVATALVLNAFQSSLVFFFTPTEVSEGKTPNERVFRVGGLVLEDSIRKSGVGSSSHVEFVVTDRVAQVPVQYVGILPDLFQEGKGVVVQGALSPNGIFAAQEVLAKHDENYMPPEAQHAMDRASQRLAEEAP